MEIRNLEKSDYNKAIQFAIKGMHFNWYMDSSFVLRLYGRYFLYLELNRAAQVLAAYEGDELAGILLAQINGKKAVHKSIWKSIYVKWFNWLQHLFANDGVSTYDNANRKMLNKLKSRCHIDGEIIFLAADPESNTKGVGSFLLSELEKREGGKQIYLFTDNACTYQFYEHRGFVREEQENIVLKLDKKEISLECYLYSKRLGRIG